MNSRSLGIIIIFIIISLFSYTMYQKAQGVVNFGVPEMSGMRFNTRQMAGGVDVNGGSPTHMWDFEAKGITREPIIPESAIFSTTTIAGTGENIAGTGDLIWTSPEDITADDNAEANSNLNLQTSDYLRATNFGYTIPTDSDYEVNGIEVTYERFGKSVGAVDATELRLVDGTGASTTVNNADVGVYWDSSGEVKTFGSDVDTWGHDWTIPNINSSNFGVYLSATANARKGANVDYFNTKIYYQRHEYNVGTTTDITGTLDGSIDGPTSGAGKIGQGLIFDGVNDSLFFFDTVSFKTLAFWMKTDLEYSGVIEISEGSSQSIDVIGNSVRATGFDKASTTIYIDGVEDTVISNGWHHVVILSTDTITAVDFVIGKTTATEYTPYFKGSIDNIRIYDRVLSRHELQRLYNMGGTATINSGQTNRVSNGLITNFSFNGNDIRWDNNPTSTVMGSVSNSLPRFGGGRIEDPTGTTLHAFAQDDMYMYSVGFNSTSDWLIQKRLKFDGSFVEAFGDGGAVISESATVGAYDISIDDTFMYVVGEEYDTQYDWHIEKRYLSDGSLDVNFGTLGVIHGDVTSASAEGISIDDTYMYVVGYDDDDLRVEKRLLSDGSFDTGFGTGGVVTGASATNYAVAVAIDDTYMYLVGADGTTVYDWRIEKRLLSTGALDTNFNGDGTIVGIADTVFALEIVIDDTYMYVGGYDSNSVRLEKIRLTDGVYDSTFGANGVFDGASGGSAYTMTMDSEAIYLAGEYNMPNVWLVQKVWKSNGELDLEFGNGGGVESGGYTYNAWAMMSDPPYIYVGGNGGGFRVHRMLASDGSLDHTFGTSGSVISRHPSIGFWLPSISESVQIDDEYMYGAGAFDNGTWYIEKRSRFDGLYDTGFGYRGTITGDTVNSEMAYDMKIDSDFMYIVGSNNPSPYNWRIEKRYLSDGDLDTNFDTDGILVGDATTTVARALAIDSTYMYVVGQASTTNWHIEKRLLSSGAYDTGFGDSGALVSDELSTTPYDIIIDSTYMYIVGAATTSDWRIEKRLLSDGSYDTGFGTNGFVMAHVDTSIAYALKMDGTYLYIVGSDASISKGRIEKRLLSDGSLDNSFGILGVATSSIITTPYDVIIDDSYIYMGGYRTSKWSVEKYSITSGALDTNFADVGTLSCYADTLFLKSMTKDDTYMYLGGSMQGDSGFRFEKRYLSDGSYAVPVNKYTYTGTFVGLTPVPGKTGQALRFDGVDDYIDVGDIASTTPSAYPIKAVSFWIKADDITTRPILSMDGTDLVEIDALSNVVATSFPAATVYIDTSSASPIITTGWHHVVINDTVGVNPKIFQIGTDGTTFFDGILDEVRIYSKVLTQKQINRLYRMAR